MSRFPLQAWKQILRALKSQYPRLFRHLKMETLRYHFGEINTEDLRAIKRKKTFATLIQLIIENRRRSGEGEVEDWNDVDIPEDDALHPGSPEDDVSYKSCRNLAWLHDLRQCIVFIQY